MPVITAPHNTVCGNGSSYCCGRMVKTNDTNIIRYMGKIYHVGCLTERIVQIAKHKNAVAARKNTASCPAA